MAGKPRLRKPKMSVLIDQLKEDCGNVSVAAKNLGFTHPALYNWIRNDTTGKLKEAVHDGNEKLIDKAENVIDKALDKDCKETAKFVMRYKGRGRGWYMHETVNQKVVGELDTNTKISGDLNVIIHRRIISSREELENIPLTPNPKTETEKLFDIADKPKEDNEKTTL